MRSAIRILALCGLGSTILAGSALADTSAKKIAFSNNYAGNSWRQQCSRATTLSPRRPSRTRSSAPPTSSPPRQGSATQAAQIQNLILQGYDAIVINASSPEALNGAIKQACDAGIVVVSFDGIVTEPCAYRVRPSDSGWAILEDAEHDASSIEGRQPLEFAACRPIDG